MDRDQLKAFGQAVTDHLTHDLLPYWVERDGWKAKNAFYGWLDEKGLPTQGEDAPWHSVLYSRLLWTFSAAARFTGDRGLLAQADRAYAIFRSHFLDHEFGGAYWLVSPDGSVLDDKKQTYGLAFWVYGLTEYRLAGGPEEALADAKDIFHHMQAHLRDPIHGGHVEAANRDWTRASRIGLDEHVPLAEKSMNTHLHVLEAFTNLLRAYPADEVRQATAEVLDNFLNHIVDPSGFFHMFLDVDYKPWKGHASYGHDIEGSWLLWEAAEVLGDPALLERARPACLALCDRPRRYGIDPDGGIIDEGEMDGTPVHTDKGWWQQAEAVVGQANAYQMTGDEKYLEGAHRTWEFIDRHIIDHEWGEWFSSVSRDTTQTNRREKVGPWKCPYHNSRMCMEVGRRVKEILEGKGAHA